MQTDEMAKWSKMHSLLLCTEWGMLKIYKNIKKNNRILIINPKIFYSFLASSLL